MPDLPPPGPERNAMVAKALGCTTWTEDGCECPDWPHMAADRSSTTNAGAIEALEAAVEKRVIRGYEITRYTASSPRFVKVWPPDAWKYIDRSATTLGDAASAAIIAAAEEGA